MKLFSRTLVVVCALFILGGCKKESTTESSLQKLKTGKGSMTLNLNGDVYDVIAEHTLTATFQQNQLLLFRKSILRLNQLNYASLPLNQRDSILSNDYTFKQLSLLDYQNTANYAAAMGISTGPLPPEVFTNWWIKHDDCDKHYWAEINALQNAFSVWMDQHPGSLVEDALSIFGYAALRGAIFTERMYCHAIAFGEDSVVTIPGSESDPTILDNLASAEIAKAEYIDQFVKDAFQYYNNGQLDNAPFPLLQQFGADDIVLAMCMTYKTFINRTTPYSNSDIEAYIHATYKTTPLPLTRPLPESMTPPLGLN